MVFSFWMPKTHLFSGKMCEFQVDLPNWEDILSAPIKGNKQHSNLVSVNGGTHWKRIRTYKNNNNHHHCRHHHVYFQHIHINIFTHRRMQTNPTFIACPHLPHKPPPSTRCSAGKWKWNCFTSRFWLQLILGRNFRGAVRKKANLVGGFSPIHLEKYANRQIGSSSPRFGVKIKNLWNHATSNDRFIIRRGCFTGIFTFAEGNHRLGPLKKNLFMELLVAAQLKPSRWK